MHTFVCILDASRISDETEYKSFVKRCEPGQFELVKLYQIYKTIRCFLRYKGQKLNIRFTYKVARKSEK